MFQSQRYFPGRSRLVALVVATGAVLVALVPGSTAMGINGGTETTTAKNEWMAAVTSWAEVNISTYEPIGRCGGTLIDPQWVLTAAHCVNGHFQTVTLGNENPFNSSGGEEHYVLEAVIHPDFDSECLDDNSLPCVADLALLKLAEPSQREPLALSSSAAGLGESLTVLGWGASNQKPETASAKLKQKTVSVYIDSVCRFYLRSGGFSPTTFRPPENLVCTGPDGIGARLTSWWLVIGRRLGSSDVGAVCPGDSGGPLVRETSGTQELVGVISLTAACSPRRGNPFEAHVEVFKFKQWIGQTMEEESGGS